MSLDGLNTAYTHNLCVWILILFNSHTHTLRPHFHMHARKVQLIIIIEKKKTTNRLPFFFRLFYYRLAVHNMHYVSTVLGIRDPIHKQKIALKAMDVVLFGPPRGKWNTCGQLIIFFLLIFFFAETGTRWKDYFLVTLLLSAIIGCWYAYQQNKNAKKHLRRMAQDMEGLQRAENALTDLQKVFIIISLFLLFILNFMVAMSMTYVLWKIEIDSNTALWWVWKKKNKYKQQSAACIYFLFTFYSIDLYLAFVQWFFFYMFNYKYLIYYYGWFV